MGTFNYLVSYYRSNIWITDSDFWVVLLYIELSRCKIFVHILPSIFIRLYIYFLTNREICEKRGTNIPIGLYRQCFNAFIAFPTSYGDKKNLFLDRYWSRLPTKRGYTSRYENDRKFLPGIISYRDFIAGYLPYIYERTPFTIHKI